MAEIVEFYAYNENPYEYIAIVKGKHDSSWNNSGRYVRESDYAALLERHRRLVAILKSLSENNRIFCNDSMDIDKSTVVDIDAALAEEVDDGPVDNHRS
jgi:hypothetical protein